MRSSLAKSLYWTIFASLFSLSLYGILNDCMLGWIPLVLSGVLLGGYPDWRDFGLSASIPSSGDVAYRAKAAGVSKKEIRANDARVDREHKLVAALVENFSLPTNRREPLPPWIEYPGYHPYHIFWRMGNGESYLARPFGPFMAALNKSEREEYFARYDLGEEWPHRKFWYRGWVEEKY